MADSNIDKKYENNVILTENAFKHLLQNTTIVNTTDNTATTGKYYHITDSMTKKPLKVVQVIGATSSEAPGTLQITDGNENPTVIIPGWPTSGSGTSTKPIPLGEAYVKKSGDTMTGRLTINSSGLIVNAGHIKLGSGTNNYLMIGGFGSQTTTTNGVTTTIDYGSNGSSNLWFNAKDSAADSYQKETLYCSTNFAATKVFNAVFNDYAEYRATTSALPGQCVVDNDDGSMRVTDKRLMPGASVVSDTFGTAMGMTDKCKTPLAVAGRVLVYPARDRNEYHAGMAVCASADGKVDIMTREEIRDYPDCIVGIVSEIPEYETWGSDNVKVDGRIWIKVR